MLDLKLRMITSELNLPTTSDVKVVQQPHIIETESECTGMNTTEVKSNMQVQLREGGKRFCQAKRTELSWAPKARNESES